MNETQVEKYQAGNEEFGLVGAADVMPEGPFEKAVYDMQNLAPYDDYFVI